jgi:hypothetical protein
VKHFLITYRFTTGSEEEWRREIARFIAALEADPALSGKIAYRCMKSREGPDYYHVAAAVDEQAVKALGEREFFTRYSEQSDFVSGGTVEVVPLEIVAETAFRA